MATRFQFEQRGPAFPLTEDERDFHERHLFWYQTTVRGLLPEDLIAEAVQYSSERLNGTRPSLWLNMKIFKPRAAAVAAMMRSDDAGVDDY